jgi:hypothetical protein
VPHGGICLAPSRGCSAIDFKVLLGREERVSGGVEVFVGLEHGFGDQRDSGIVAREEFMQLADEFLHGSFGDEVALDLEFERLLEEPRPGSTDGPQD